METTEEEKMVTENCHVCKKCVENESGNTICSMNMTKPAEGEVCSEFEMDELKQAMQPYIEVGRSDKENKYKRILFWLGFFLWMGVAGGTTMSIFSTFVEMTKNDYSPLFVSLSIIEIATFALIAVMTINAFLRRRPNAVALATTYIAMVVLDGIISIIISDLAEDTQFLKDGIREVVWGCIWFAFLRTSNNVKTMIPVEKRTWETFEKVIITIYVVVSTIISVGIFHAFKSGDINIIMSDDATLDSYIEGIKEDLPMVADTDLTVEDISKDSWSVKLTYRMKNTVYSPADKMLWTEIGRVSKHELLHNISNGEFEDDDFFELTFKLRKKLVYRYIDLYGRELYTVAITPEEYNEHRNTKSYKCPTNEIDELIKNFNQELPIDYYIHNYTLTAIRLSDNGSELVYELEMREMSPEVAETTTADFLKEKTMEVWDDNYNNIIILATMNQMNICYEFRTPTGTQHTRVEITPEVYNNL